MSSEAFEISVKHYEKIMDQIRRKSVIEQILGIIYVISSEIMDQHNIVDVH